MLISPWNELLLHASPRDVVGPDGLDDANGVKPGSEVPAATGVLLKETVGNVPDVVGAAPVVVASPNVGREAGVSVGSAEGAARAVCVNCAESCPIAVATAAVLIALTSTVGAGAAPTVQADNNTAAAISVSPACRGDL